jgi:hypothetical protein
MVGAMFREQRGFTGFFRRGVVAVFAVSATVSAPAPGYAEDSMTPRLTSIEKRILVLSDKVERLLEAVRRSPTEGDADPVAAIILQHETTGPESPVNPPEAGGKKSNSSANRLEAETAWMVPDDGGHRGEVRYRSLGGIGPRPQDPTRLLTEYFSTQTEPEKRACKRVYALRPAVAAIAAKYSLVDPETLLAIIKVESEGRQGRISHKHAVGLAQIKYQGAFSFLWDAWYKTHTQQNGRRVRDHYNAAKRRKYAAQLADLQKAFVTQGILGPPGDAENTKPFVWKRLKAYLTEERDPPAPLLDVEIAAMYLDHVIHSFKRFGGAAAEIRRYVESRPERDIGEIPLTGTRGRLWALVWKSIQNEAFIDEMFHEPELTGGMDEYIARVERERVDVAETTVYKPVGEGPPDPRRVMLHRLAYLTRKTDEPRTWYAAYNTGPTNVLKSLRAERGLPRSPDRYAEAVMTYRRIFEAMHAIETPRK